MSFLSVSTLIYVRNLYIIYECRGCIMLYTTEDTHSVWTIFLGFSRGWKSASALTEIYIMLSRVLFSFAPLTNLKIIEWHVVLLYSGLYLLSKWFFLSSFLSRPNFFQNAFSSLNQCSRIVSILLMPTISDAFTCFSQTQNGFHARGVLSDLNVAFRGSSHFHILHTRKTHR